MIGIYCIRNKVNGKCYVGQAQDIEVRWNRHKYDANNGSDYHIHRAFRKYGIDQFEFSVLEECDIDQLNDKEIYWIDQYDSFNKGYNMTLGGDGYNLGKNSYSKEYREQYNLDHKDEIKRCMKECSKQYYLDHKEQKRQYSKQYNLDHKERKKQYMKEYMRMYRNTLNMKALPNEIPLW